MYEFILALYPLLVPEEKIIETDSDTDEEHPDEDLVVDSGASRDESFYESDDEETGNHRGVAQHRSQDESEEESPG
ncbi:MAG: hypothetical protein SGARI_007412, partial [Bacillariaceae sp.]